MSDSNDEESTHDEMVGTKLKIGSMSFAELKNSSETRKNSRKILKAKRRGPFPSNFMDDLDKTPFAKNFPCSNPEQIPVPPTNTSTPTSKKSTSTDRNCTNLSTPKSITFQVQGAMLITYPKHGLNFNATSKNLHLVFKHLRKTDLHMPSHQELSLYREAMKCGSILKEFYSKKPTTKVLGLEEKVWNDVFRYLDVPSLKTLRSTCRKMNEMVQNSFCWAVKLCFIHDEKIHTKTKRLNPVIPLEQICADDTVGWPDFRIRNFTTPFFGKKYFSETVSSRNQLLKTNVYSSVKTLEIHDCTLRWYELLETIAYLPNLEELVYSHTKEYLNQNNVLKILQSEAQNSSEVNAKAKAYKRRNLPLHLKKARIQGLNLEINNFLLAILNQLCKYLEILEIFFLEQVFLIPCTTSGDGYLYQSSSSADKIITDPVLDVWKLIHNNQESLKSLKIAFLDDTLTSNIQQFLSNDGGKINNSSCTVPVAPIFSNAIYPKHEKLGLFELVLEFPPSVNIPASKMKYYPKKTKKEITTCENTLMEFCISQVFTLFYLSFKTVTAENYKFEENLVSTIDQLVVPTVAKIGKSIISPKRVIQWSRLRRVDYDLSIYLDDASVSYPKIFDKNMPVMESFKTLQVIENKSTPIKHFNICRLVEKFPLLTRLVLVSPRLQSNNNHKIADFPKINDADLQSIICFVPWLVELVLVCNMSEVTDAGLTGIIQSSSDRMNKNGKYKILEGDLMGHPISTLKHLEVLEMHGLGIKVTGVTSYFAFEGSFLEELYLFSPKFTKRQKKDLKDKFAMKKNFKMNIF